LRLDAGLQGMGAEIGAALDGAAREKLVGFLLLLVRWNRAFNLTAVRAPLEMVPRHLLDSLAALPWIERGPVLDIGTGAGLPGIPLAIARPELAFTLLDSVGKKVRFVRQAAIELGLENVEVVQARVAAYRPPRKFATIVARAVASLPHLVAESAPLAAAGGRLLAFKGRLAEDELSALARQFGAAAGAIQPALAASSPACHPLAVPEVGGERNLIEVPLGGSTHG
jgi:16S rRNA (guanine527-N7)-methyltransferase